MNVGLQGIDRPPPIAYPVGESPYHKKGLVYTGSFAFIEERVPGGLAAVVSTFPVELKAFFAQTFLAAAWYDFLPCLRLYGMAARVSSMTTVRFLMSYAEWQARENAQSINRLIFTAGSIEAVAARLGSTFSRSYDFAEVSTVSTRPGAAVLSVRALPAFLFDWYRFSMQPAASAVLELAGACEQRVDYTPLEADGERDRVKLIRFEIHRTWKEPGKGQ